MSYKLTKYGNVIRHKDGAEIPKDPSNRDYKLYVRWLEAGGEPEPADTAAVLKKSDIAHKEIMSNQALRGIIRYLAKQASSTEGQIITEIRNQLDR